MASSHEDISGKLRLLRVPGGSSRPHSQQRSARCPSNVSSPSARSVGALPRGASPSSHHDPFQIKDPFQRHGLPRTPPHSSEASPVGASQLYQNDPFQRGGLPRTPPHNNATSSHAILNQRSSNEAGDCEGQQVFQGRTILRTPPSGGAGYHDDAGVSSMRSSPVRNNPRPQARHFSTPPRAITQKNQSPHSSPGSTPHGDACHSSDRALGDAFSKNKGLPRTPPQGYRTDQCPKVGPARAPPVASSSSSRTPPQGHTKFESPGGLPRTPPQGHTKFESPGGLPRTPAQQYKSDPGTTQECRKDLSRNGGLPRTPPQDLRTSGYQPPLLDSLSSLESKIDSVSSLESKVASHTKKQPRHKIVEELKISEINNEFGSKGAPSFTTASASSSEDPPPRIPPRSTAMASSSEDTGQTYLNRDELKPFRKEPKADDVLKRLATSDWSTQFNAIDDVRRITLFVPEVLQHNSLHGVVEQIVLLAQSLRSTVAKNALRCLGELITAYGARLDQDLSACAITCLRRAADTNHFIAEEANQTLRDFCSSASSGKLATRLVEHSSHKSPAIRAKALWGLAMVAQRLKNATDPTCKLIAQTVVKALGDANPNVRASARAAAVALIAGNHGEVIPSSIYAAIPEGMDVQKFDAYELDTAIKNLSSCGSPKANSKLAQTGVSLLRDVLSDAMPQSAPQLPGKCAPSAQRCRPSSSSSVGAYRASSAERQNLAAAQRCSRSVQPSGRR